MGWNHQLEKGHQQNCQAYILHINRFYDVSHQEYVIFLPHKIRQKKDASSQTENSLQTVSFRECTRWDPTSYIHYIEL